MFNPEGTCFALGYVGSIGGKLEYLPLIVPDQAQRDVAWRRFPEIFKPFYELLAPYEAVYQDSLDVRKAHELAKLAEEARLDSIQLVRSDSLDALGKLNEEYVGYLREFYTTHSKTPDLHRAVIRFWSTNIREKQIEILTDYFGKRLAKQYEPKINRLYGITFLTEAGYRTIAFSGMGGNTGSERMLILVNYDPDDTRLAYPYAMCYYELRKGDVEQISTFIESTVRMYDDLQQVMEHADEASWQMRQDWLKKMGVMSSYFQ